MKQRVAPLQKKFAPVLKKSKDSTFNVRMQPHLNTGSQDEIAKQQSYRS